MTSKPRFDQFFFHSNLEIVFGTYHSTVFVAGLAMRSFTINFVHPVPDCMLKCLLQSAYSTAYNFYTISFLLDCLCNDIRRPQMHELHLKAFTCVRQWSWNLNNIHYIENIFRWVVFVVPDRLTVCKIMKCNEFIPDRHVFFI